MYGILATVAYGLGDGRSTLCSIDYCYTFVPCPWLFWRREIVVLDFYCRKIVTRRVEDTSQLV